MFTANGTDEVAPPVVDENGTAEGGEGETQGETAEQQPEEEPEPAEFTPSVVGGFQTLTSTSDTVTLSLYLSPVTCVTLDFNFKIDNSKPIDCNVLLYFG